MRTIQSGLWTGPTSTAVVRHCPQLKLGYQFTPWMRGTIGYDFIFLSAVARPGNQIDNTYDGVIHPIVPMKNSDVLKLWIESRFAHQLLALSVDRVRSLGLWRGIDERFT